MHGLWERPLGDFTAFLRKEGFNALRLPLSAELMLNLDGTQPNGINFQANPELQVHLVVYLLVCERCSAASRGPAHSAGTQHGLDTVLPPVN